MLPRCFKLTFVSNNFLMILDALTNSLSQSLDPPSSFVGGEHLNPYTQNILLKPISISDPYGAAEMPALKFEEYARRRRGEPSGHCEHRGP